MTNKENSIASAITIIGVLVIVCGIFSGLYFGSSNEFYSIGDMQGIVCFGIMVNGNIWGIIFLGIAEVIKLLQGIFNQREVLKDSESIIPSKAHAELGIAIGDKIYWGKGYGQSAMQEMLSWGFN
jgi:hypothetical protein